MSIDRPLRFCMVTTFYPPYNFGGDGIYVQRLSNELARRGHHVEVIHSIDAYRLRAGRNFSAPYDNHPNIMVHGLASTPSFLSALGMQQTGTPFNHTRRIRQILRNDFDVINYHNVSLVGGPRVLGYGRAIKLYTFHEYWLVCPTHVLFRNNREACAERHCLTCSLIYKRPPQLWRYGTLLQNSIRHVDRFIASSQFCIDAHRERGLSLPATHLPFFVPAAPLAPHVQTHAPYFLFVGRLEKLKGLQTLIPIFRNYPRAQLLIAGRGNQEAELRAQADGSPHIEFLGHQTGEQLRALYRQALALIVPSLCFEASPTVILEAAQQQTPVIARNLGAMPELIRVSEGGLVYSTEAELIAATNRLVEDSNYRNKLGIQGYQTYQREWTTEKHLQRYFDLIEEIGAQHKTEKNF